MTIKKEVLRTGTFTDARGKTVTITDKTLTALVDNFSSDKSLNSEGFKVPLFLGHPEDESTSPAHGWVKSLVKVGETLVAEFEKLTEGAEKAIKDFSFRDVSVSVYKNILQHIGLTNTPAVPGLADFQYAAPHKDDLETWTFTDEQTEPETNIGDNMSEEMEIQLSAEKKELEIQLTGISDELKLSKEKIVELEESSAALEAEKVELSKAKEDAEAKIAELEKASVDAEVAAVLAKDVSFIEKLVADGILAPADKDAEIVALNAMPVDIIELSAEKKSSIKEMYMAKLSKSNVQIKSGEAFSAGFSGDKESELVRLSNQRASEKGISYVEASNQIISENPKLNLIEA